ncbi:MAG: hypothetical protein J6Q27_02185, partial [Clostridia bacterium]|nr:hypothetical protein [Clostridia bacterium]
MNLRIKQILLILLAVCLVAGGIFVYRSQNPTLLRLKKYLKHAITWQQPSVSIDETNGLSNIEGTLFFEDGIQVSKDKINPVKDNKKVYLTPEIARLVNYTDGYLVDLPKTIHFDFALSPLFVKGTDAHLDVTISQEKSPYEDVEQYIAYFLNRFILDEAYQKANGITVSEETLLTEHGYNAQLIRAKIENAIDAKFDGYAYAFLKTDTDIFYRMMLRYDTKTDGIDRILDRMLQSFVIFPATGDAAYHVSYHPKKPAHWSAETAGLYETICATQGIRWGVFTEDIYSTGIKKTVPQLEEAIDYQFPVILAYLQHGRAFPTEFMQTNYENGKLVELTYQITGDNNQNLFGYTPNLDIYRGTKDEEIRAFARAAKAFGHPFLFRLNNEMNSDWTSYSGIINMSDPDIYVENWRRFYRIFEEEGVHNAIWVFNPNDNSYPPCNWNHFLAYYPGDDYVQMIGLTGYNTGTYYLEETGEIWREFE